MQCKVKMQIDRVSEPWYYKALLQQVRHMIGGEGES